MKVMHLFALFLTLDVFFFKSEAPRRGDPMVTLTASSASFSAGSTGRLSSWLEVSWVQKGPNRKLG